MCLYLIPTYCKCFWGHSKTIEIAVEVARFKAFYGNWPVKRWWRALYSIECIFHKRKSQLSIDLVWAIWPSTSNSALSNLLCFVVSLTDMLFIYSIVLFIYSTTGWSRASTLYVWIQAGNRYRKPVQHSIAKVLRFTAKKWTRLELQDPLPKR